MDTNTIGIIVLVILVLGLGYIVNQHSLKREPVYGGAPSIIFNFLTGLFFVAILPTVCMSVLVLRPEAVDVAGITFNPVLLTIIIFALLSIFSSILFAIVEKTPLENALAEQAKREATGWTEEDARTSGL
jgi:hypothetical protein